MRTGMPTAWWQQYFPDLVPLMLTVGPYLPLAWWVVWSVAFAVGNYFLARRLGGRPWLWALLTLLPVVGLFFQLYVGYTALYAILDRVDVLRQVRERIRS